MYYLNLPLPPSLNSYYGHHCKFKHATVYIKTKGKEYRSLVLDYVLKNDLQLMASIPLSVDITFVPKTAHKQDVDNILKCALDALTHASVWEDDSLVYKLTITKKPPCKDMQGLYLKIEKYDTNENIQNKK